jgi:hypothetical protein
MVDPSRGWQIIGLNAQLLATGSDKEEAQFAWLDVEIERGRGPVGVMLHNLFRNGPFRQRGPRVHVRGRPRRRLLDALARRHLRCVVAGHTHRLRRLEQLEPRQSPVSARTIEAAGAPSRALTALSSG